MRDPASHLYSLSHRVSVTSCTRKLDATFVFWACRAKSCACEIVRHAYALKRATTASGHSAARLPHNGERNSSEDQEGEEKHTNLRLLEERLVSWWERARQSAAQEAAYVQTGEETTIKVPTTVATSHHRIGVRIEATTRKTCTAHAHRMLERRARWGERGGAPAAHRDQMTLPDGDLRAQAIRASRHGCRARHRAQSAAHTFALLVADSWHPLLDSRPSDRYRYRHRVVCVMCTLEGLFPLE